MMNGMAGIVTTNPGPMYHGASGAAGSGYVRTLITRKNNATKFTRM